MKLRKKYIDLLRLLALFYMFFQHAVLVLLKPEFNRGLIYFLFEIVPLCPALFLFVSGYSVSLAITKDKYNKNKFIFHLFKRGIILIICGSILFIFEHGFQLPDFIICSNILNSIGWMLIISALLIILPFKEIITFVLIIVLICLTWIFQIYDIQIVPFNYGYEPIVPTIIFGFIGLLFSFILTKLSFSKKILNITIISIGITGLLFFIIFSIKYGFFKVYFVEFGRYTVRRSFNTAYSIPGILNLINIKKYTATIWNYKINCFFASLSFIFMIFSAFYYLENFFQKFFHKNIFLPGQFAFLNYFFHFIIIGITYGIIYLLNLDGLNTFQFIIFLIILFIFSYLFSYLLNIKKQRKISRKTIN